MSNQYLNLDECSICLELLDNKFQKYLLECGHQFHTTCLKDWYNKSKYGYKCPLCNEVKEIVNVTENNNEIVSFVPENTRTNPKFNRNKSHCTIL